MWRSCVVGHGVIAASQILANPHNHRKHPKKQRELVEASIRELGFLRPVIINRTTGHLVDGHERVMQALAHGDETPVDVTYIELSLEKEKLALLLLDKTSEMAQVDEAILEDLIRDVHTGEQVIADLLTEWGGFSDEDVGVADEDKGPAESKQIECPKCGHVW